MDTDYQAVFNEKTMTALEEMATAVVRCAERIQQSEERIDNSEQTQNYQIALNNRVVEVLEKINRDLHKIEQRLEDLEQVGEANDSEPDDMIYSKPNEQIKVDVVAKGGCPKCDGTGWITQYDSVPMPFGSGNCQMPTDNPCECWTGESPHCPRCGSDNLEWSLNEVTHCLKCGWSSEDCESTDTAVIYPPGDDVDYTHTNLSQFR